MSKDVKRTVPIRFVMFMKSNCPIFQWGMNQDLPQYDQIKANIGGFFGAFSTLVQLLDHAGLISEDANLDNIRIGKALIYYRDKILFQSIYIIESMGLRNKRAVFQLMEKIDNKFSQMFGNHLKNWNHSVEPFEKFKDICDGLLSP